MKITPEMVQIGLGTFVQIVGLLSAWKQERKGEASDRFEDFITWLEMHHFDELSRKIFESDELNRELHSLLSSSLEGIDSKLASLEAGLANIAAKIDGLSLVGRAAAATAGGLSPQACEILKLFANADDCTGMTLAIIGSAGLVITMIPNGAAFRMDDQRFVNDDVQVLEDRGLLHFDHHTKQGSPFYTLTRAGATLAKELPEVEIRHPE